MTYNDEQSTKKMQKKNGRTRFWHLCPLTCVFERIMGVNVRLCPLLPTASIQYTHFQAANAINVNTLTFLIDKGLMNARKMALGALLGVRLLSRFISLWIERLKTAVVGYLNQNCVFTLKTKNYKNLKNKNPHYWAKNAVSWVLPGLLFPERSAMARKKKVLQQKNDVPLGCSVGVGELLTMED